MSDSRDAQHTAEQDWTWSKTASPNDKLLTVFVETQKINLTNEPTVEVLAFGTRAYVAPTKFKDLAPEFGLPNLNHLGVAEWVLVSKDIGGPRSAFHFFKDATGSDIDMPYDESEEVGNHYWPMVVLAVWTEVDYSITQSYDFIDERGKRGIITGPGVKIVDRVIPDVEEGTRIITRKFLTARRPNIPYHKIPHPMSMTIAVPGDRREYPKVLHGDIFVESVPSGTRKWLSDGTSGDLGGATASIFYEATNFEARKRYTPVDRPTHNEQGLWERVQLEVIPPRIPEVTRRNT